MTRTIDVKKHDREYAPGKHTNVRHHKRKIAGEQCDPLSESFVEELESKNRKKYIPLRELELTDDQDDLGSKIGDDIKAKSDYSHIRNRFAYDDKEKKELNKDLRALEKEGLIKKETKENDYESQLKLTQRGKKYFDWNPEDFEEV